MRAADCVVMVTGAASGLGAGVSSHLLNLGASVVAVDREPSADPVPERQSYLFCPADVTDSSQVASAMAAAVNTFGRIDVCVNAAGINHIGATLTRAGEPHRIEDFRRVVEVDLVGTFEVCRQAAAAMSGNDPGTDGERGLLVNVSSISAFDGTRGSVAYVAAKAGVAAMTLPMARDLARFGIRVMTICPGAMDTSMVRGEAPYVEKLLSKLPLFPARYGTPLEFARLVVFFIENPLLNGEVVRLDAASRVCA